MSNVEKATQIIKGLLNGYGITVLVAPLIGLLFFDNIPKECVEAFKDGYSNFLIAGTAILGAEGYFKTKSNKKE